MTDISRTEGVTMAIIVLVGIAGLGIWTWYKLRQKARSEKK